MEAPARVASIDKPQWGIARRGAGPCSCSRSRGAIALDMESATIEAKTGSASAFWALRNALCVSDKPLHGELKVPPRMATEFYKRAGGSAYDHRALGRNGEVGRTMPMEALHSRKLRKLSRKNAFSRRRRGKPPRPNCSAKTTPFDDRGRFWKH